MPDANQHATTTTEASPLLQQHDERGEEETSDAATTATRAAATRALVWATVFLVLFALADLLKYVSTVRLLELGVCREYYHGAAADDEEEQSCKSAEIQRRLARLRGYYSALDAVVGLVLTIPYGLLIGRLGERVLVALNIVGYLLACAWFLAVSSSSSAWWWTAAPLPISAAVLAPLFRVVGGGSPFLYSLVYSMAAARIPGSERSSAFFVFLAAQTITSTVATLIAAALLDNGLLSLPLLLNFPIGLLCILSLAFVRGGDNCESSRVDDEDAQKDDDNTRPDAASTKSVRQGGLRVLGILLRDPVILVLLATVPIAKAVNPVGELTWQYIPKRFGISFAMTSRVLSIPSLECVVLLLFVLPQIKAVAQTKHQVAPTQLDLYFVQYGFLIQAVGCLVMAAAPTLAVFILGILVFALGCSTRPALQSVLAGLANPEHVAVLFTLLAVADLIGSAAGALLINWAFAVVLDWEMEAYLGLPFALVGVCFAAALVASVLVSGRVMRHQSSSTERT